MANEFKLSYTGAEINSKLGMVNQLSQEKADKTEIPTKVSELTNDSGFLTSIPNEYVTEEELDNKGYLTDIPSEYVTDAELDTFSDTFGGTVEITSGNPEKENTVVTLNPDGDEISVYTVDEVDAIVDELSKEKVNKTGITLDKHTDGLVYSFVDGQPKGNGVELGTVVEGDVIGTIDENNNILLSGDISDGTYTFKFLNKDGTYTDVGTLVVGKIEEPDTNLADPTSADWQEGYRISLSKGTTSALEGHTTTNYIPCKRGDVLRVKGLRITGYGAASEGADYAKICAFNANKSNLSGAYGATSAINSDSYGAKVTVEGDVSEYTLMILNDGTESTSDIAYIRIDGFLMDGYTSEDVIITINEEIPA